MLQVTLVSDCRERFCHLRVEEGYSYDTVSGSVWEAEGCYVGRANMYRLTLHQQQ
jgi:hypothetical protein